METSKYNTYLQRNSYTIQTETHQGVKHLIIPVVMMVEGVHDGSAGPVLHTQEEMAKFPASWDGIPVTVGHPLENGQPISANSPGVVDHAVVGRVYHTKMNNGRLKGEVWADVEKLKQASLLAYAYIMQQKPLEVSVGVFSDDELTPGQWETENYVAIAHNYRPDHLALLPDTPGACSWLDGCGIRVNTESLLEAVELVTAELYSMDTQNTSYYLEQVYDDGTFIYRKRESAGSEAYYKRDYQIKDGAVIFGSEIIEVKKEVKYKKILTMKRTINVNKKGGSTMEARVKELKTIAPSLYTEDDTEWLLKMEKGQIDKLIACAKSNVQLTTDKEKVEAEQVTANERTTALESEITELKKGTPQINEEAALKILKDKVSDIKTFGEMLPPEMRGQFEYGQRLYDQHRTELVASIIANQAQKVWTPEKLANKDTSDLQDIANSIKPPVSYEGAGGGGAGTTHEEEILMPPSA